MMNHQKRNAALACLGLLALSIYILACTSFSPDDTKVLYPSFDTASGALGLAVYDRDARNSEMLFVPVAYGGSDTNMEVSPCIFRAQWLANGRDIVMTYVAAEGGDKDGMSVVVMPWGTHRPTRVFRVPEVKDMAQSLVVPLCIAGEQMIFRTSDKACGRLDLRTGALTAHEFEDAKGEISTYPAPDGAGVFYFESDNSADPKTIFGRLNPTAFSRTPLMVITNRLRDMTAITYDLEGKLLALLASYDEKVELEVWREGRQVFSRSVDIHGGKRIFANAVLAPNGKSIRAAFQQANGTNSMSYGLMEIPFSEAPARETTLIRSAPVQDEPSAFYFQMATSHDGKTAAIASTYLALMDKPINASDCALFFVDLSDPNWKVTKVPIPLPAKRAARIK
jgi:hypothetical protein